MVYKQAPKTDYNKYIKSIMFITIATFTTYAIMAVITHFSLNYLNPGYKFNSSLQAIFDTKSTMFKFFSGFVVLYTVWIISAIFLKYIKKNLF